MRRYQRDTTKMDLKRKMVHKGKRTENTGGKSSEFLLSKEARLKSIEFLRSSELRPTSEFKRAISSALNF